MAFQRSVPSSVSIYTRYRFLLYFTRAFSSSNIAHTFPPPALMPGMNDAAIGKIVSSIDDAINNRLDGLVYLRTDVGKRTAARFGGAQWDEATTKLFEDGVMAWKKAQDFHASGIKRFKSFSEELLERNIRSGVTISDKEVLQAVVRDGQPDALLRYLKSVTPSGRATTGIQTVPQSVFDDAAKAANAR